MKQQTFTYKQCVDLGFKREDYTYSVFFNRHGYNPFWLNKNLPKRIVAEWDCETHTIELVRYNKDQEVLGRLEIQNEEQLKGLLKFFSNKKDDFNPYTQAG